MGHPTLIYGPSWKPAVVELILAVDPGNGGLGLNPARQTSGLRWACGLGWIKVIINNGWTNIEHLESKGCGKGIDGKCAANLIISERKPCGLQFSATPVISQRQYLSMLVIS